MAWQGVRLGSPLDSLRVTALVLPLLVLALCGDWWAWWGATPLKPFLHHVYVPLALAVVVIGLFGWPVWWRGLGALLRLDFTAETMLCLGAAAGLALALREAWYLPPDASAAMMLAVWRDSAFAASLISVAALGDIASRADRIASAEARKAPPTTPTLNIVAGDLIPLDAVVREGRSEIQDPNGNDDIFPSVVGPGDRVHAGSRNGDAALVIVPLPQAAIPALPVGVGRRLERLVQIACLVMLLLVLLVFGWRYLMGPPITDPVSAALRLLMLSTPLGLGLALAAPAAELLRATRQLGLEVHDVSAFERLLRAGSVIFGHRGVLIPERHRVISVQTPGGDHGSELVGHAAAVAQAGHDPWGRSVLDMAVSYRMRLKNAGNYEAFIGEGVMADVAERKTLFGTRDFLEKHGIDCHALDELAQEAEAQGRRLRWVGETQPSPKLLGFIAFGAPSVAGAVMAVKNLDRMGLTTGWLADAEDPGHAALRKHLKIDHLLPMAEDKTAAGITAFRKRHGAALLVAAEAISNQVAEGLGRYDMVLPFGRRATAQWPQAPIAIPRQDPRLVVDILLLAARYRRLVITNLALVFVIAATIGFVPFLLASNRDLGSYEIVVILLLAVSSLSLRALPGIANEVDEE